MTVQYHKADPIELEGQFRALPDGSSTFEGYAAVFGQRSKALMDDLARGRPYVETLAPGAFRRSIGSNQRKSFVVDHNERMMISSTPSGPLQLAEDTRGVHVMSPWPRTDYADNARALYDAGERLGMSIFFSTRANAKASNGRLAEEWNARYDERTVNEGTLRHVSVLATMEPAYDGTMANFRALADLTEADVDDVDAVMEALRDGRRLTDGEFTLLNKLAEAVKPETSDESATPVVEPETDAERAITDKWITRVAEIEATLPKS